MKVIYNFDSNYSTSNNILNGFTDNGDFNNIFNIARRPLRKVKTIKLLSFECQTYTQLKNGIYYLHISNLPTQSTSHSGQNQTFKLVLNQS